MRATSGPVQFPGPPADTGGMNGPDKPRPIFSAFAEDPALQDAIDGFVISLAGRVDDLQDCELRGDLERLVELAGELLIESDKAGYDVLSRCAAAARGAARDGKSEESRKALIELTEVAQRVRLGHRGAV